MQQSAVKTQAQEIEAKTCPDSVNMLAVLQAHVVQFLGACIEPNCMTLVTELMDKSLDKLIYDDRIQFSWEKQ